MFKVKDMKNEKDEMNLVSAWKIIFNWLLILILIELYAQNNIILYIFFSEKYL